MGLRLGLIVSGLISAGFFAGCGGSDGPLVESLVPASGKLLVDGQPMEGVTINFIPEAKIKGRRGGTGVTNASGEFTITDLVQNKPGVPVGKYTVSYSRLRKPDGSAAPPLKAGETPDPANIQIESFPAHLTNPDPAKPHNQVEIPKDGNTKLELKASTKNASGLTGPGISP